MDCEQALTLISSRLDREIAPSENDWLSEHLRDCPACRATAEAFALQHEELKHAFKPRRAAVVATVDRVNAAVDARSRRRPRAGAFPRHPGVYWPPRSRAAVLVAVVLVIRWD